MPICSNPIIPSIPHHRSRLPHNLSWWRAYPIRSSRSVTIQTTQELKPQILRLSPITCYWTCGISSMNSALWEYAKLRPHFQHRPWKCCACVCCTLNAIVPKIMVCISHFSSSQCNVTVKYADHSYWRPHVACEQNVCLCASLWHCTPYAFPPPHLPFPPLTSSHFSDWFVAILGSTFLMKAVKLGRSPRCKERFFHAQIFAMAFTHSLNLGIFGPIRLGVYRWMESTAIASLPTLDSFYGMAVFGFLLCVYIMHGIPSASLRPSNSSPFDIHLSSSPLSTVYKLLSKVEHFAVFFMHNTLLQ